MSDFDSVVERYLAVWNETDAAARRKRIDDLFAEDVRYVDPLAAVTGRDALDGLVGAVQQQFPGFTFSPPAVTANQGLDPVDARMGKEIHWREPPQGRGGGEGEE